jgi:myo-inositol-1(or 4)-monophosphatase
VGSKLRFEDNDVTPKLNPAVRRRLAGVPVVTPNDKNWETRKTGSAAIECALVAAGMLRVARFESPNIWDVAGGIVLVEAAGGAVRQQRDGKWETMRRFVPGSCLSSPRSAARPIYASGVTPSSLARRKRSSACAPANKDSRH